MAIEVTNLQKFNADLDKFAKKVELDIQTTVKKVGIDLFTMIVKRTPVDTGRCRASWQINAGDINNEVAPKREGKDPIPMGVMTPSSEVKAATLKYPKLESIYITNSLDYAQELEHGSSKQSPSGMVAVSIASMQTHIDRLIKAL
jgi:hypothetical protein